MKHFLIILSIQMIFGILAAPASALEPLDMDLETRRSLDKAVAQIRKASPADAEVLLDNLIQDLEHYQGSETLWMQSLANQLTLISHHLQSEKQQMRQHTSYLIDRSVTYLSFGILGAGVGYWLGAGMVEDNYRIYLPTTVVGLGLGAAMAYGLDRSPWVRKSPSLLAGINTGLQIGTGYAWLGSMMAESSLLKKPWPLWLGAGLGAGLGGVATYYHWLNRDDLAWVASGALWGGALGWSTSMMTEVFGPFNNKSLYGLIGSLSGAMAAGIVSKTTNLTQQQSWAMDLGGFTGGVLGIVTSLAVDITSRPLAGTLVSSCILGGMASGLLLSLPFGHQSRPQAASTNRSKSNSRKAEHWFNRAGIAHLSPLTGVTLPAHQQQDNSLDLKNRLLETVMEKAAYGVQLSLTW